MSSKQTVIKSGNKSSSTQQSISEGKKAIEINKKISGKKKQKDAAAAEDRDAREWRNEG
jgi:hypothetical protein